MYVFLGSDVFDFLASGSASAGDDDGAWTCKPLAALKETAYSTRSSSASDERSGTWIESDMLPFSHTPSLDDEVVNLDVMARR